MTQAHTYLVGHPCQSVADVGAVGASMCGEPARFLYLGLVPDGMTPAELKRRGHPCTLLLCPDHAKALAYDFSWQIRDGKTRIERLDMPTFRFHCHKCGAFTKVVWDQAAPALNPGAFRFCPRCGAAANAVMDPEQDYWDVIQESFEGMPIQLLQLFYNDWDRTRFRTFRAFVEAQVKAFDTTGDMLPEDAVEATS